MARAASIEFSGFALNSKTCRWRHPVFGSAPRLAEDATSGIGFPPDAERDKRIAPSPSPRDWAHSFLGRVFFQRLIARRVLRVMAQEQVVPTLR